MNKTTSLVTVLTSIAILFCGGIEGAHSGTNVDKITPEQAGWSSQTLDDAARKADELGYSAFTIWYDGKDMFSWGDVQKNYKCHSIRKAFLSALYGIYVEKGMIDLDLTIEELKIDDTPSPLTETEKKATIRQLLQARSGIYHPAAGETADMENSRPERGSHPPGTFFYYNNWDFNVLGTIFKQLTGEDIFEAFQKQVAVPIGMQDFDPSDCYYEYERDKSEHPLYGFRMSARDMARFGTLYLDRGVWSGKQIIPETWIVESTTSYSNMGAAGFGYMWGVIQKGTILSQLFGYPGYFFSGLGVHDLAIVPESKYVLVLRMDTDDDFDFPDRAENGKLFQLISDARPKQ